MKKIYTYGGITTIIVIVLAFVLSNSLKVAANPTYFAPSCVSASATSTAPLMQAPSATSTLIICDSYDPGMGTPTMIYPATLLLQLGATSTSAVLGVTLEYADGQAGFSCKLTPTACDWYSDTLTVTATTLPGGSVNITVPTQYNLTGSAGTSTRAISILTPTRYFRVRAKMTGAPGFVYGQAVLAKERTN